MRTKHLCVLIHIRTKAEVGTIKHDCFADRSKVRLLLWILFYAPNFGKVEGAYCFGLVRPNTKLKIGFLNFIDVFLIKN